MDGGLERLFHVAVVVAAGASAVYLMTKASISARQNTLIQDDIEEVPTRDREEVEDEEEDSDLLSSYWAGSIPEGTYLLPILAYSSSSFLYLSLPIHFLTVFMLLGSKTRLRGNSGHASLPWRLCRLRLKDASWVRF